MNDCISREALEKWLLTEMASLDSEADRQYVIERLRKDIPAADVRPVVRGEWEPTDIQNRPFPKWFQCSNCKTIFGEGITGAIAPEYGNRTWNFCPICGADMRKEVQE